MKEPAMAPQARRDAAAISDGGGDKVPTRSDTSRLGDTAEATICCGTALSPRWVGRTYLHLSRGNGLSSTTHLKPVPKYMEILRVTLGECGVVVT